jgi:cytochrome c biogenesis protein
VNKDKNKPAGERVWAFFTSVKLSFFLLLALATTSILGTVIPQKEHPGHYEELYWPALGWVVEFLGLHDMYHAPWFLLLMALLAVNLIICSLTRLPDALKIIRKDPIEGLKRTPQPEQSFTLAGSLADYAARARGLLAKAVGPVTEGERPARKGEEGGTGLALFAQKGAWSRLGVYVVHLSVLIIFAGAMLGNILGFSGRVNIPEGATVEAVMQDNGLPRLLGFAVRLDNFTVSFYKDGMPSEYRSDLTFLDQGREAMKAVLKVNDPAVFKGVDFYQSSYGQNAETLTVNFMREGTNESATLMQGEWVPLPGGGEALALEAWKNVRMGDMYEGPAARVYYKDLTGNCVALTALKGSSKMPTRGPVRFEIVDMKIVHYTGLSVKYDPGVWLIWGGGSLMVLGFIFTFYTSHRNVWITLIPAGKGRIRWELAGSANKNRLGLRRLLERLAQQAQAAEGSPSHDAPAGQPRD